MEEDRLISDEELVVADFATKPRDAELPKDGLTFRVAEVIPLWWGELTVATKMTACERSWRWP